MAAGKINLQKASGGVTAITGVDGASNTNLVLPESGTVSSVDTAVTDNAIARYDGTTGKLQDSGVVIDDSGNVGVGVTPSAWGAGIKALDLGLGTAVANMASYSSSAFAANCYYNDGGWKYKNTYNASLYEHNGTAHYWQTAPAGTAGNPIAWTNAMRLTSSELSLGDGTANIGSQLNCYGFNSFTNNFEFVQRTGNKGFTWYVNAGSTNAMTLGAGGNLLVGTSVDNGVDKLQVNGSISSGLVRVIYDLNNITNASGFLTGDFTFSLAANSPCGYGTLHQIARGTAECTQMVQDMLSNNLFIRRYVNSAWTAWVTK